MAKLKDLPREDYPREKALRYGFQFLTNSELIAIILGSGSKGENVLELSQKILSKYTQLNFLASSSVKDLVKIKGINTVKALKLLASLQLSKRLHQELISNLSVSNYNSQKIFEFSINLLSNRNQEVVILLLFDSYGNLSSIKEESNFQDCSIILNNYYIKALIDSYIFSKIILIHNHVNGDTSPTLIDLKSTEKVASIMKQNNITLVDHLIVCSNHYFSFRDNKLLKC